MRTCEEFIRPLQVQVYKILYLFRKVKKRVDANISIKVLDDDSDVMGYDMGYDIMAF